ncbi:MAG: ROK family protein [Chloroflexota bacterium]
MEDLYVLVDLGGTHVRVALAHSEGSLAHRHHEKTDHQTSARGVIDQIARMGKQCLDEAGSDWKAVKRSIVASPGPLNPNTGVVYAPPNMPGWGEVRLGDDLEKCTGAPVVVVNDANAGALGEYYFGAGRGCRNLVYLTVSTGIGGGVVVDGRLLEGSLGTAGEIGHMTVDFHGPPCNCGSVGCLEAIASGTSIARRFAKGIEQGKQSVVTGRLSGRQPTAADVAEAAAEGDAYALEVFTESAEALGFGIVSCIHIFNPDVVVLGGGVTASGSLLFSIVNAIVQRHALPIPRGVVRILPAELGDDVGLMGAAAVAWSLHDSTPKVTARH